MEIFDPETNKTDQYSEQKKSFFPRSELNDWLPTKNKIIIFLIGFIGLNIVSYIVSFLIAPALLLQEEIDAVETIYLILALINFLSYFIVLGGIILFMVLDKRKTIIRLGKEFTDSKAYIYALSCVGVLFLINLIFGLLSNLMPNYSENANQSSLEVMIKYSPVLTFFTVAIFAPILEELTYRIGLIDTIGHKNRWLGIILSSIIFGFIHFDWNAVLIHMSEMTAETYIDLLNELVNLPVYILSGVALGFFYCKSGRISTSIIAHSLINTISFISIIATP